MKKGIALIAFGAVALFALPFAAVKYQKTFATTTASDRARTEALTTDRALANSERFYDLAGRFDVRVAQVQAIKDQLALVTDPDERARLNVDYGGVRSSCLDVAAQYNADARKTTRAGLRDAQLPESLDAARCP
ncbi:hypothetical protein [Deinococcus sp. QL22]|uniref:hypothetical protein n=1 Tax=Deinococcus sp. QL22 TaxID=2939437 RepID=UPI002016B40E|nr:hypothetical protein [Deinococcus sp. QL22]UQN10415.1 hypothetical protein M1R55_30135 [Deinococcus sp. QL22]UQN10549.1 hypothetical protein M1R55_29460 [Deinococcus sp. QL22]